MVLKRRSVPKELGIVPEPIGASQQSKENWQRLRMVLANLLASQVQLGERTATAAVMPTSGNGYCGQIEVTPVTDCIGTADATDTTPVALHVPWMAGQEFYDPPQGTVVKYVEAEDGNHYWVDPFEPFKNFPILFGVVQELPAVVAGCLEVVCNIYDSCQAGGTPLGTNVRVIVLDGGKNLKVGDKIFVATFDGMDRADTEENIEDYAPLAGFGGAIGDEIGSALFIDFQLTANLEGGSANANVLSYSHGENPGATVVVYDSLGQFKSSIAGAKGKAHFHDGNNRYEVITCDKIALFANVTLGANCGNATVAVSSPAVLPHAEFQQAHTPSFANNPQTLASTNGDSGLIVRVTDQADPEWQLVQVKHNPHDVVDNVYVDGLDFHFSWQRITIPKCDVRGDEIWHTGTLCGGAAAGAARFYETSPGTFQILMDATDVATYQAAMHEACCCVVTSSSGTLVLSGCPELTAAITAVEILDSSGNVLFTLSEGTDPDSFCFPPPNPDPYPAEWGYDGIVGGNGFRWWFWRQDNGSGGVTYIYAYEKAVDGVCDYSEACSMECPSDTRIEGNSLIDMTGCTPPGLYFLKVTFASERTMPSSFGAAMVGVEPIERGQYDDPLACEFRGEKIGEKKCELCGAKERMEPVYECALHGICTLRQYSARKAPEKQCLVCNDRHAGLEPMWDKQIDPRRLMPTTNAFNGSMIEFQGRKLMAYRFNWDSGRIVLCELGDDWQPMWNCKLVFPESPRSLAQEDPRLFIHNGKLHVSYTAIEMLAGGQMRTSVHYARLQETGRTKWAVDRVFEPHYEGRNFWEKNWGFFEHAGQLYAVYTVAPHKVLKIDGDKAELAYETDGPAFNFPGEPRGGAAPVLHRGEFFSFVHTFQKLAPCNVYRGAVYTFEAQPPFRPLRAIPYDILAPNPEHQPFPHVPHVVYPSGAARIGNAWIVSYGYYDHWIHLRSWDANALDRALRAVKGGALDGVAYRPATSDLPVYKEVVIGNDYELPDRFEPRDVIVDIGGHIGAFSTAVLTRGAGRVIVAEPYPQTVNLLRKNLAQFGDRATIVEAFISDKGGEEVELKNPDSVVFSPVALTAYRDGTLAARVRTMRINDLLPDEPVRLLKIDCEGAEYAILQVADLGRVQEVRGEAHRITWQGRTWTIDDARRILEAKGFTVRERQAGADHWLFWAERKRWQLEDHLL